MSRPILGLSLLLCLLLPLGPLESARAEDPEQLYEAGKAALEEARYDAAEERFVAGFDVAPAGPMRWRMALGLALSHELRGDGATAVGFYRLFLDLSEGHPAAGEAPWKQRRERAAEDVASLTEALAATHGRLRLETLPAGARIVVDGELAVVHRTPATFVLEAGPHRVELSLAGHRPQTLTVDVDANERARLQRSLTPVPPPPAMSAPAPAPAPVPAATADRPDEDPPAVEVGGYIGVGLGAAALTSAIVLTGFTAARVDALRDLRDEPVTPDAVARDRALRDTIAWMQPSYVTLYAVGGLAAASGLLMLLWPSPPDEAARMRPEVGPARLGLRATF